MDGWMEQQQLQQQSSGHRHTKRCVALNKHVALSIMEPIDRYWLTLYKWTLVNLFYVSDHCKTACLHVVLLVTMYRTEGEERKKIWQLFPNTRFFHQRQSKNRHLFILYINPLLTLLCFRGGLAHNNCSEVQYHPSITGSTYKHRKPTKLPSTGMVSSSVCLWITARPGWTFCCESEDVWTSLHNFQVTLRDMGRIVH